MILTKIGEVRMRSTDIKAIVAIAGKNRNNKLGSALMKIIAEELTEKQVNSIIVQHCNKVISALQSVITDIKSLEAHPIADKDDFKNLKETSTRIFNDITDVRNKEFGELQKFLFKELAHFSATLPKIEKEKAIPTGPGKLKYFPK